MLVRSREYRMKGVALSTFAAPTGSGGDSAAAAGTAQHGTVTSQNTARHSTVKLTQRPRGRRQGHHGLTMKPLGLWAMHLWPENWTKNTRYQKP